MRQAQTLNEAQLRSLVQTIPDLVWMKDLAGHYLAVNPAVERLVGKLGMENYVEDFRETFRWHTNWKVLAENFMESYHLPVCHAGTIGGLSKLDEMICPPSPPSMPGTS